MFEIEALGTVWWIDAELGQTLKSEIADTIQKFERDFSRFMPDSYLSRLNDAGFLEDAPQEMLEIMRFGMWLYQETSGVYNISIGAKLEKLGYGRTPPPGSRVQQDLLHSISIDNAGRIELRPGTRIDIGGFGKGWLVDSLVDLLQRKHVISFVINGGGDIRVGSNVADIHIEYPGDSSQSIGVVKLSNRALASSSRFKRQWSRSGKKHSHIQPPDTSSTVPTDILSIHVLAPTTALADAFATTFLLVPHEERVKLANHAKGVSFLEIRKDYTYWTMSDFPWHAHELSS